MSTQPDPIALYVNFALYAVLGGLREADQLMRDHGNAIRLVAKAMRARFPFEAKPLHRGLLMDSAAAFNPSGREFTSWSESEDVAEWFADPRAYINEHITATYPWAKGFLLSLSGPPTNSREEVGVLFHYSWAAEIGDFGALARRHPMMGVEGARQIAWSLSTQKEVITEPLHATAWPERRPFVPSRPTLDHRLAPPWAKREET